MSKELWLGDVQSIGLEAMDVIEKRLKERDIVLTDKQEDEIYLATEKVLEEVSNGNYRHEH